MMIIVNMSTSTTTPIFFDVTVPPSLLSSYTSLFTPSLTTLILLSHYHADHLHFISSSAAAKAVTPLMEKLKLAWMPFLLDVAKNSGKPVRIAFYSPSQVKRKTGIDVFAIPAVHVPVSLHYLAVIGDVCYLYHLDSREPTPALHRILPLLLSRQKCRKLYVIIDATYIGSTESEVLVMEVEETQRLPEGSIIFATATRTLDLLAKAEYTDILVMSGIVPKVVTAMKIADEALSSGKLPSWLRLLREIMTSEWLARIVEQERKGRIEYAPWSADLAVAAAAEGRTVIIGNGYASHEVARKVLMIAMENDIPVYFASTPVARAFPPELRKLIEKKAMRLKIPGARGHMTIEEFKKLREELDRLAAKVGLDEYSVVPIHTSDAILAAQRLEQEAGLPVMMPTEVKGRLAEFKLPHGYALSYPPTPVSHV